MAVTLLTLLLGFILLDFGRFVDPVWNKVAGIEILFWDTMSVCIIS
ncbi:MAG: hypothetical protein AAB347_12415 [Bacteroidota bacterium]